MKRSILSMGWKAWITLLVFNFIQIALRAQDSTTSSGGSSSSTSTTTKSVDVTTNSTEWYASPWVWIIGAAIFILLLVALLSGSRRSTTGDRVTVTRTVERDTDV